MLVNCFSCRGNADAASPGRGGSNYIDSSSQLLIGGALFAQHANVDRTAYDKVAAVWLAPGEMTAVSLLQQRGSPGPHAALFHTHFHTPRDFLSPNDMALFYLFSNSQPLCDE